MGLLKLVNKTASAALVSLALLSDLNASAEDNLEENEFSRYNEVLDNKFQASYLYKVRENALKDPLDINTLEGFIEKSLYYSELEFENYSLYNNVAIRGNEKINYNSEGLNLLRRGIKRSLNETKPYEDFQIFTSDLASYITENTLVPIFRFTFGEKSASKTSKTTKSEIGLDFDLGGNPADIRELHSGNNSYKLELGPGKVRVKFGGNENFIFQLTPRKVSLALREYNGFSSSISLKENSFNPFAAKFDWKNDFTFSADSNYRIRIKKLNLAVGANYTQEINNRQDIASENSRFLLYISGNIRH